MYNYYRDFTSLEEVREYEASWAEVFNDMFARGLNELHNALPGYFFRVDSDGYHVMATA